MGLNMNCDMSGTNNHIINANINSRMVSGNEVNNRISTTIDQERLGLRAEQESQSSPSHENDSQNQIANVSLVSSRTSQAHRRRNREGAIARREGEDWRRNSFMNMSSSVSSSMAHSGSISCRSLSGDIIRFLLDDNGEDNDNGSTTEDDSASEDDSSDELVIYANRLLDDTTN